MPESVSPGQRRALRLGWQFVRPYRRQMLLALLALVVTAAITLSDDLRLAEDVPVADVKQFVALVKAGPDKYSYGSFGAGTTSQFAGEMFFHAAGVKIQHVPYKGSAPAMTDLIGGQIPFTVDTVSAALPHLKDGKVKAIAVTTAKRTRELPELPTLDESGFKGFAISGW